jgi:inosine-uridine nucleoside N-ribohydrolase
VFRSGVPITAVGLDVTMRCKLEKRDIERLRAANHPASRFLVRLIELWQNNKPDQYPTLHDPLAVAVVFQPGLIETQLGAVQVETSSPLTNGMTVFTPAERVKAGKPSTLIARDVDPRKFLELFVARLSAPPRAK